MFTIYNCIPYAQETRRLNMLNGHMEDTLKRPKTKLQRRKLQCLRFKNIYIDEINSKLDIGE